jgi:SAM-dependent methyltransferase
MKISSFCEICSQYQTFESPDEYWSCRSSLKSQQCPYGGCVSRERAIANAVFRFYPKQQFSSLIVHEAAPSSRGFSFWLRYCVPNIQYVRSGYWPDRTFGSMVGELVNCDLTNQHFDSDLFDIVFHLDVLEHVFDPWKALQECVRTLKPGGRMFFTVPIEPGRLKTEQVAFLGRQGEISIVGKPEYHGNPQRPDDGALVTYRYGYDITRLIAARLRCDVEMYSCQSTSKAILGPHSDVFVVTKL